MSGDNRSTIKYFSTCGFSCGESNYFHLSCFRFWAEIDSDLCLPSGTVSFCFSNILFYGICFCFKHFFVFSNYPFQVFLPSVLRHEDSSSQLKIQIEQRRLWLASAACSETNAAAPVQKGGNADAIEMSFQARQRSLLPSTLIPPCFSSSQADRQTDRPGSSFLSPFGIGPPRKVGRRKRIKRKEKKEWTKRNLRNNWTEYLLIGPERESRQKVVPYFSCVFFVLFSYFFFVFVFPSISYVPDPQG